MDRRPATYSFRRLFWRHERTLVAVTVGGLLLFGGVFSVSILVNRIRVPMLDGVEQLLENWDNRWTRRVEYGERLVNTKQYGPAVEYLLALDRDFPARNVRHGRDGERERILRALGRSYDELGKKSLTLATYRRLVEFDPRNFESHHLLAQASLKFKEPELAQKHLGEILKMHPSHLPSVRAQIKIHFDKGDYGAVAASFERYLNGFLMQPVVAGLGQSSARANVAVDGLYHAVQLRLAQPKDTAAELSLQIGEYAIEIEQVTLQGALAVGQPGLAMTPVWPSQTAWRAQDMVKIGEGRFRALGPGATLRLQIPAQSQDIAAVHLKLRLFKPIDSELWRMARTSYQRLLKYDDFKTLQARSVLGSQQGDN